MDNDFPGNMSRACATAYFHQFSLTWEGRRRVNLLMNFKKYRAPWECSTGSFIIILLFHRITPCTDGFVYSGILTRSGWGRKKKTKQKEITGSRGRGMGVCAGIPLVIRIVQSTGIVRVSVRFFSIILVSSCFLYFEERISEECLLRQYCV